MALGSNLGTSGPPAVRDPALAHFLDRRRKNRVTADITARLPKIQRPDDVVAVARVLLDTTDSDTVRNEAANLLRRSGYDRLTKDLIQVLEKPDEKFRFRAFAVQHLWQNFRSAEPDEQEQIRAVMDEALTDRHLPVRREALLALVRIDDPLGEQKAVRWLTDPEADAVRDLAIRCVKQLDLREHIPAIRKHARDANTVIRIAALVALSQWGDEESRPAFEEAVNSPIVRLQRAGQAALVRLDSRHGTD